MQPHVLIIGYGDLGSALGRQLSAAGCQVTGVKRSPAEVGDAMIHQADVTVPASLKALTDLKPDILVYCVAAGGQSDAQYQAAYVDGLKHVLDTQTDNQALKHVFFVSSTRVYGQHTDHMLDENHAALPSDFGGERLLQAEQLLTLNRSANFHSTVLRLSGIYGPGRLRMIRLAQTGEWPAQDSWSNRIHRDDAAGFIAFLIKKVSDGATVLPCYIVTDAAPVPQYEVLAWLASQLKVSFPADYRKTGTQAGLSGKRLSNGAMIASGYALQYPDYQAGYGALIASLEAEKGHA